MDAQAYARISAPFRRSPRARRLLEASNNLPTWIFYCAYPLLLALLLLTGSHLLLPCIIVPCTSFLLVSMFRKQFNAPRPYEALDIDPLIVRDGQGESFPSRHVFSAALISGCWFAFLPTMGVVLYALTALLAAARVVGGIHYPRDVVAGAAIGIACGLTVIVFG